MKWSFAVIVRASFGLYVLEMALGMPDRSKN